MDQVSRSPYKIVLLVEPDQATRQLYIRALRPHWRVLAMRNVDEALAILNQEEIPHAAVIEPYGSSHHIDWDLLTGLRDKLFARRAIPLILCSTVDERGVGYAWGATAYLLKPVSPEQLVGELARILA